MPRSARDLDAPRITFTLAGAPIADHDAIEAYVIAAIRSWRRANPRRAPWQAFAVFGLYHPGKGATFDDLFGAIGAAECRRAWEAIDQPGRFDASRSASVNGSSLNSTPMPETNARNASSVLRSTSTLPVSILEMTV